MSARSQETDRLLHQGNWDDDDDNQDKLDWAHTSRVKVTGYVPDLDPLQPGAPRKPVHRAPTPAYGAIPAEPPSTPVMEWVEREGVQRGLAKYFREGSVRGSIFNLCSATLGAGALGLPYAFAKAGLAMGTLLLTLGALATVFSIRLLIQARTRTDLTSYEDLTVALFGKVMGCVVEVNIIVFCFGTAVAYCRAVGDILEPVMDKMDVPDWLTSNVAMAFFWLVVMFPLSLIKTMNSLRFSSFFGVVTIGYLVVATMTHTLTHSSLVHDVPWKSASFWFAGSFSDVLQAAPIVIFAFTCQVNVFAIYDELERASERRMGKVTNRAICVCFAVYILMGFFGYTEFQGDTCGNILGNYKHDLKHNDGVVFAAYICITLTILMAFPLVIFPCRYTIEVMLGNYHVFRAFAKPSMLRHFFVTLAISGSALVLSLVVPNISLVFQLVGGTTSAFVCFVLPAAFAIKLRINRRSTVHTVAVWCLAIGGSVVGALSTALTIADTVQGKAGSC